VLAIVLFIGGYTFLTLHYRKPGRAYEPYADMKERANTGRLLSAGYQRLELPVERPADPLNRTNNTLPARGGLPQGLSTALVAAPAIPRDVLAVNAADTVRADEPYAIAFRCSGPDDHQQLGNVHVYLRGAQIIVAPNFERLAGGLETRSREILATTEIPAHTLRPGTYDVTMVGESTSRAWRLVVR
jgi:hypothetical protein